MSEHTPGPWESSGYDGHGGITINSDARQIGYASMCREQEANARLIAAAPDLLEALKAFVEDWSELSGKVRGSTLDKIDAAIAKAEGN